MRLYTYEGIQGYTGEDIDDYLAAVYGDDKVISWHEFIYGQTMCSIPHEGTLIGIVYRWDFERFMEGRAVID